MKSYKERLPMIDEAVEELGGKWPEYLDYSTLYYSTHWEEYKACHKESIAAKEDAFCTRTEFEARAKELGWVNGYKWGVEYETNGVKPDLPDDLKVVANGKIDRYDLQVVSCIWSNITSFRITDERYKPKSTSKPEVDNWHERGELPPVGEVCKLVSQGLTRYGFDVEITYIGGGVGCYKRISDNKEFTFASGEVVFRPIQSERDELVGRASKIIDESVGGTSKHMAQALYDAGMLTEPK